MDKIRYRKPARKKLFAIYGKRWEYEKPILKKVKTKYSINEISDRYCKFIEELKLKINGIKILPNRGRFPSFSQINKDYDFSIAYCYLDTHSDITKRKSVGEFPIYYNLLKSNFILLDGSIELINFNLEMAYEKAISGDTSGWIELKNLESVLKRAEKHILSCDKN